MKTPTMQRRPLWLDALFGCWRSSSVQQLYYAELRQKVLRSQSRHQEALFFQLAASALQAEVGDVGQRAGSGEEEEGGEERQERKHRLYFLPEDYFPSWVKRTSEIITVSSVCMCCNILVSTADEASWTRLPAPALPAVARRAERCVTQPSCPAVYKRGLQPAGRTSHLLQDETGQSNMHSDYERTNENLSECCQFNDRHSDNEEVELFALVVFEYTSSWILLPRLLISVQEKKEVTSSVLLGVALKGVCIYQVCPPQWVYTLILEASWLVEAFWNFLNKFIPEVAWITSVNWLYLSSGGGGEAVSVVWFLLDRYWPPHLPGWSWRPHTYLSTYKSKYIHINLETVSYTRSTLPLPHINYIQLLLVTEYFHSVVLDTTMSCTTAVSPPSCAPGQQVWNLCSGLSVPPKAGVLHSFSLSLQTHPEAPQWQSPAPHQHQGRSQLHPTAGRHGWSAVSSSRFSIARTHPWVNKIPNVRSVLKSVIS